MQADPNTVSAAIDLIFVARNLERIGDHATNIAETIHYLVVGEAIADERPKSDTSSLTKMSLSR